MPSFVARRVDPTPEEINRLFEQAYHCPAVDALSKRHLPLTTGGQVPSAAELLRCAAGRAEGAFARNHTVNLVESIHVIRGACWWTDRVGRRHWYVEGAVAARSSFSRLPLAAVYDDPLGGEHPLLWVAPELSCGWRTRGGQRELVVICPCGACGPPAAIGWAGSSCGPCFDREQEGLPPVGPPLLRRHRGAVISFALSEGGLLLTIQPRQVTGLGGSTVRGWAPPWAGRPIWERQWVIDVSGRACNDHFAAVWGWGQPLALVRLSDGETCM